MSADLTLLGCQKQAFSLPDAVHYFNCAYMSPQPRAVAEAGARALLRKNDPSALQPEDFFVESDVLRALFARLISAPDAAGVALVPAVSYGVATVARNLDVRAGQNIVIAGEQFPSNVYAWRRLCAERGVELRTVHAPDSRTRGAAWNELLLAAIDTATALVALPHVHWTDGTRFDLESIAACARTYGALVVVDGTQSIGALPFDAQTIRPDAVLCAGYKWLLGPYSLGLAWYGDRLRAGVPLEETWIGRRGSEDFRGLVEYRDEYADGAARFDVGERSNFLLVPMLIAALELLLDWRPERIQAYCERLMRPVLAEAEAAGFQVEAAAWRASHLFGVRVRQGDTAPVAAALRRHAVSASLRGSALRVAPHVYNDERDADALCAALRDAALETGGRVSA